MYPFKRKNLTSEERSKIMILNRFISVNDLSISQIYEILNLAHQIIKSPDNFSNLCNGKIMGTLFFEPSTRTRLSFESAMLRLGGSVLGLQDESTSSTTKGETLADTIKTISQYVDIIAMRHSLEGSAMLASEYSDVPLINGGDGGHHHPTQTLTDLLTILETKKSLEDMTIGLCGDLMFGRTVHSLIEAMAKFGGNRFILISPPELNIPKYIKAELDENNIDYKEVIRLENVIDDLDVLYMTRVQKERFLNEADYERLKDSYILDKEKLENAKEDLAILHPLPRVNEIQPELDDDPRAKYFDQAGYGVYARMALILTMLGREAGQC